jgi:hypothetical protein
MAGPLRHSAAYVMRKLLIDLGLASEPSANLAWQAFVGREPNVPDQVITVLDAVGRNLGSLMQGEQQEVHGFQVRVRSTRQDAGYVRARQIAVALDAVSYRIVTVSGGHNYLVNNVHRAVDVIYLGEQKPESSRFVHVVNALAHVRQQD